MIFFGALPPSKVWYTENGPGSRIVTYSLWQRCVATNGDEYLCENYDSEDSYFPGIVVFRFLSLGNARK